MQTKASSRSSKSASPIGRMSRRVGRANYLPLGLYPLETPRFPTGDRRFLSKTRLPCRYKHVLYSVLSPRSLITSRWLGQRPRFSTSQALPFPLSGQGSTTSSTLPQFTRIAELVVQVFIVPEEPQAGKIGHHSAGSQAHEYVDAGTTAWADGRTISRLGLSRPAG